MDSAASTLSGLNPSASLTGGSRSTAACGKHASIAWEPRSRNSGSVVESWWGPEGFRVEVHTLEARVGGTLHYDMVADAPEQIEAMKQLGQPTSHETRGRFAEIRPLERLAITHVIDFLPVVKPYESTMVVEFFPSGETVRMVITLDPMHDEEFTKMSTMGMSSQLTKLEKRFGGRGPSPSSAVHRS